MNLATIQSSTEEPALLSAELERLMASAAAQHLEAEAYVEVARSTRIRIQDGDLESFTLTEQHGLGVRVIADRKVGYAYTESFDTQAVEHVLAEAASNAALLEPDDFAGLEPFVGPTSELGLFNPGLAGTPVDRKIAFALELDRVAHGADPRVKTVTGASYGDSVGYVRIASTLGLDRQYRSSLAWGAVQPLVCEGDQSKTYGMFRAARCFEELNPEWMAAEAVRRCTEKLHARQIQGGTMPVVFSPEAFGDLLGTFVSIFSAKTAHEGKSLLKGRVGERIAAPVLNLLDDPLSKTGLASRPCDDEGCPSRTHHLIEEGTFKGFLHNAQTARRDRTVSTGHAVRGGYQGTLRVGRSNLVVLPGADSRQNLLDCSERTLEVTELTGLHAGANAISGDFSLQAQGFMHERGERVPVHLFTVSGNFYQLLEAVAQIGTDQQWLPSGIATPSVRISSLAVAGK